MRLSVSVRTKVYRVELERSAGAEFSSVRPDASERSESNPQTHLFRICRLNERDVAVDVVRVGPDALSIVRDGKSVHITRERSGENFLVVLNGVRYEVSVQDMRSLASRKRAGQADGGTQKLIAAMPGKVVRVLALEGSEVAAGEGIVVLEAMKMQNEVRSPKNGMLKKLMVQTGTNVNAGDVLAVIE